MNTNTKFVIDLVCYAIIGILVGLANSKTLDAHSVLSVIATVAIIVKAKLSTGAKDLDPWNYTSVKVTDLPESFKPVAEEKKEDGLQLNF